MTVVVTPTLFVGAEPMSFWTSVCTTAADAAQVIRAGGSARVATMETAAEVLRLLGCDEQTVGDRVSYALLA